MDLGSALAYSSAPPVIISSKAFSTSSRDSYFQPTSPSPISLHSGVFSFQSEFMFDGERCEICMEIIVDRGVLDCCNGRFCFVCIDNWATITTLCPLCQGEIRTIKCVPAYDTFGSKDVDTNLFVRDCDWHEEGKDNNAISFPSCYIDEKAVTCLDGDECKLRGGFGSVIFEEESDLDTSIACDSCDIWYHAFCVGFDLDDTSRQTWLCPRCMVDDEQQQPSKKTLLQVGNSVNEDAECFVDAPFSGKLSISLAGVGETAVVISLVDVNGRVPGSLGITPFSNVDGVDLAGSPSRVSPGMEEQSPPSRSQGSTSTLTSNYVVGTSNIVEETTVVPYQEDGFSPIRTSSAKLDGDCLNAGNSPKVEATTSHLDFPVPGEDNIEQYGGTQFKIIEEGKEESVSEEPSLAVEKFEPLIVKQVCESGGVETEYESNRLPASSPMVKEVEKAAPKAKKTLIFKDNNVIRGRVIKERIRERNNDINDDIMSIVRGTGRRPRNDTSAGPRLKKIRRISAEEDGSSTIIEKLRKDIREAACNSFSEDPRKSQFGSRLLGAFKMVVVGPTSGDNKTERRVVGNGKTELWKRSRVGVTKLEKIETLKSVLDSLRNEKGNRGEEGRSCKDDTILSRLYLADTSVIPRKDDIKPFSVTKRFRHEQVKEKEPENRVRGSVFSPQSNHIAGSSTPRENKKKQITDRSDKKRWALEVLARRTGTAAGLTGPRDDPDTALLKANYPLLAQLPCDMRPIVTPDRSCKVPPSVRQVQLYRMAEHFLKAAKLASVRRTAATEFAVADAVNIENSLARTSSCKSVYLNLCSRELLRPSERAVSTTAPSVEAALKSAGFLSDSPPTSPDRDVDVRPAPTEDGPDNILETSVLETSVLETSVLETSVLDTDLNIYGDFDYDLGEEQDYIGSGSGAVKADTVEAEVKMKVLLSVPDPEDRPDRVKLRKHPSVDEDKGSLGEDGRAEESFRTRGAGEGGEERLREECMELYGPDKEGEPLLEEDIMEGLRKGEAGNPIAENRRDSAGSVAEAPPSPCHSETAESVPAAVSRKRKREKSVKKAEAPANSVYEKVRGYVKEHIKPLWRSGVITGEAYRWAAKRTAEKVMRYHRDDSDATFLVKEGPKVRKLAEQYVEAHRGP